MGEDSAAFRLGDQRVASWAYFAVILAAVLWALNVLWIDPDTGVGTRFLDAVASVSDSHEVRAYLLACLSSEDFIQFRGVSSLPTTTVLVLAMD